jgi:hypothetical protein
MASTVKKHEFFVRGIDLFEILFRKRGLCPLIQLPLEEKMGILKSGPSEERSADNIS